MDTVKVILTSLLSAATLFLLAKIMGHKQVAQLDLFDYIPGITIGSIAAELATELETPWKPLIAMLIFGGMSVGLSILTGKLPKTRKYMGGTPTILMNGGKLYRRNLKKAKLDLSEFLMLCREQGYFDLSEIQTAVFEHNGKLTVLPVSTERPATPSDLNLTPPPASIHTEVILDGRILEENLKSLDAVWLDKQLKAQGYHTAKEIFPGLAAGDNQLSLYALE